MTVADVNLIYNQVQFGAPFLGMPADYCNPVKMMRYLGGHVLGHVSGFHNVPGNPVITIPMVAALLLTMTAAEQITNYNATNLPALAGGQYAIEICTVAPTHIGLHYILREGSWWMYNPWYGVQQAYPAGLVAPPAGPGMALNPGVVSTNSGILLA